MYVQVSKLKSQLEKQRAHLREERKMEIATLNDKVYNDVVVHGPASIPHDFNYMYFSMITRCVRWSTISLYRQLSTTRWVGMPTN